MRGFYSESINKVLQNYGHIHISIEDAQAAHTIIKDSRYIERHDTYAMILGLYRPINVSFMDTSDVHFILGKRLKLVNNTSDQHSNAEQGIYIGHRLAQELGIEDTINNCYLNICYDIFNTKTVEQYKLQGIFNIGFYDFDANQVFVTCTPIASCVSSISVYLPNPQHSKKYQKNLKAMNINSETWQETHSLINRMFKVNARGVSLLIGLFILASAIQSITNLTSLMHMRCRDFTILEQMGMSRLQIFKMILSYGLFTNIFAILFSVFIGLVLCVSYISVVNVLEKYGYTLIDQDSFWISKIIPIIKISDIILIESLSFMCMFIIVCISAFYLTRKPISTWNEI